MSESWCPISLFRVDGTNDYLIVAKRSDGTIVHIRVPKNVASNLRNFCECSGNFQAGRILTC